MLLDRQLAGAIPTAFAMQPRILEIDKAAILVVSAHGDRLAMLRRAIGRIRRPSFRTGSAIDPVSVRRLQAEAPADVVIIDIDGYEASHLATMVAAAGAGDTRPVIAYVPRRLDETVRYSLLEHGFEDVFDTPRIDEALLARTLISAVVRNRSRLSRTGLPPLAPESPVAALLDRLPLGIVIIDRMRRVRLANERARALLDASTGLTIDRDGICRASHAADRHAFDQLVRATLDGVADAELGCTIGLQRHRTEGAISALVAPLHERAEGGAVIFLADPSAPPSLSTDALARLHGLTPAEARLTALLANGATLETIAGDLGLSQHTVRSQLRQIFRKTDTNRQAELIKLVLTGPAALPGAT
ncbi:helix-turn-helix transcriptional regulator [Oceanibacterium hippocampi]|uniref:Bacterial regulatory proteins, luxR family n=1 Tax=Oceanibacterium hippocampi TaxID=745714 RepID=A0A1Y5RY51_9PROT|nr:helix-turn-helix transcriptional regulator [Oceanibacterium hippocampi]SLN28272.1 Bacterial regulatory proteins, luxR family [Oceanibacterium hippocampi]